ncbi:MAG: hypothetical protein KDA20_05110 [Phycisphaerales bacterium]|nr:hypothetical protein [Phycisphaerales bacterium]
MKTMQAIVTDPSHLLSSPQGTVVSRPVQLPVTKVDDSFAVAWAPTQHSLAHTYSPARVTPPVANTKNDDRGSVSEPVN